MGIDVESPGADETDLRTAISNLKTSFDSITAGASPVAASPETDVTYVTTGGTAGAESVTLALPSSPATKIGKIKRVVVAALGDPGDLMDLAQTNLADANGDALNLSDWLQNELSGAGSSVTLKLIYHPNDEVYRWQIVELNAFGFERNVFTRYIYPLPNSAAGTVLSVQGGYSSGGSGGKLLLKGGDGNNGDGADVEVIGGFGGDGRGGDVVLKTGSGTGGRNGVIQAFSGLDSYADDAAAEAGGIPQGGLYRTGSAVKIRVT